MKKEQPNKADELLTKINEKFETLAANLDSKQTEDEIKNYFKFAGQFHKYSLRNQMLIADEAMFRNANVEHMASFKTWSDLKNSDGARASVKKGERGFTILVPTPYIKYELDSNREYLLNAKGEKIPKLDEQGKVQKGMAFKAGTVFDVNQTTAKEIGAYKTLDYRSKIDINEALFERLKKDISEKFNVNIDVESIHGGAKGYYSFLENKIAIDPKYTTSERISTLYHELGHHLIHGEQFKNGSLDYSNLHENRGAREGEAESFSYILSSMSGIENKSELYIKTWGNDAKDLKERFELITGKAKEAIQTLELESVIKQEHFKNLISESKSLSSGVSVEDVKFANIGGQCQQRQEERGISR